MAFLFVCLAVPLTLWDVAMHFTHWNAPELQRYVVRILWMVPVYSVNAWFALRYEACSLYLDTLRECYEAYVIFNFYAFMLAYLRRRPDFDASLLTRPDTKHLFPLCRLTCANSFISHAV